MRRILAHIEKIERVSKKIMFQIKLPTNVTEVKGIMVEANLKVNFGGIPLNKHVGQLTLRIPEKRDVFYSKEVFLSAINQNRFQNIEVQGLSADKTWMTSGTKREFFKIDVPVSRTIIEGFYEDQRLESKQHYQLNIYLQLA